MHTNMHTLTLTHTHTHTQNRFKLDLSIRFLHYIFSFQDDRTAKFTGPFCLSLVVIDFILPSSLMDCEDMIVGELGAPT